MFSRDWSKFLPRVLLVAQCQAVDLAFRSPMRMHDEGRFVKNVSNSIVEIRASGGMYIVPIIDECSGKSTCIAAIDTIVALSVLILGNE